MEKKKKRKIIDFEWHVCKLDNHYSFGSACNLMYVIHSFFFFFFFAKVKVDQLILHFHEQNGKERKKIILTLELFETLKNSKCILQNK